VRHTRDAFEFTGEDIEVVREGEIPVVHWVPAGDSVETRMRTMDGDVKGYAEPGVEGYEADDVLQFERVGFVRVDDPGEPLVAYFTHP